MNTQETKKLRSIKCTNCGAPLVLHGGGHKVRSVNCEFCGSVLDTRQHFAVLHQFSNQERPYSPFKLGMQGEINGIEFTIIGVIGWQDVAYAEYEWVDLLLFSQTRGYAWLTYYRGHLVFSRRTREIPNLNVWNLAPKFEFSAGERKYQFFERSRAHIVYVAGELTWVAHKDDSVHLIEAIAPPYMYSVEHSGSEVSYGIGEYLEDTDALYASFGVEDKPFERQEIHPAQPYRSRFFEPLSKAAKPFVPVAALGAVLIWLFFEGSHLYEENLNASALKEGASTHEFEVTQPGRLLELTVDTQLRNAWSYFDVSVRQGPNNIFSFGKEVSFYEGRDSDGYWSEGSRGATAHFKVPEAGKYSLHITQAEGGTGNSAGGNPPATNLRISLKQGYISNFYFVVLLILSGLAALSGWISRIFFESKRWKSVLGDDDE